jgi:hypothetical protein
MTLLQPLFPLSLELPHGRTSPLRGGRNWRAERSQFREGVSHGEIATPSRKCLIGIRHFRPPLKGEVQCGVGMNGCEPAGERCRA